MSMKLLPASVDSVDPPPISDVSTSVVPFARRAITTQSGQVSVVPSADAFTWSSRTRAVRGNWLEATLVEDSQSDEAGRSTAEYVSGWAWSNTVERSAIAHYVSYAGGLTTGRGRLIDLYA